MLYAQCASWENIYKKYTKKNDDERIWIQSTTHSTEYKQASEQGSKQTNINLYYMYS